ncbi:hypothetical protein B0O99DRAFT_686047 [Bisporella sp. PMI_857]|nr:hypothetical protein B0O99DRAFT_686047 [Bisporella sp. PMI_857]
MSHLSALLEIGQDEMNQDPLRALLPSSMRRGPWQAIVNAGDGRRFLSQKKLYSSLHRVVRGGMGHVDHRYSLAYLLCPDDELEFEGAESVIGKAKQFVQMKYNVYAASHEEQQKNPILCGGVEEALGVHA